MLTALCEALILYMTAKHLSVDRVSLVTLTQEMDSVKATSSTVWQSDGSKDTFKSVGNKLGRSRQEHIKKVTKETPAIFKLD